MMDTIRAKSIKMFPDDESMTLGELIDFLYDEQIPFHATVSVSIRTNENDELDEVWLNFVD